jgi:hypothetical protein
MSKRVEKDITVEVKDRKPYRVEGVFVSHVIDRWRLWQLWWEGLPPRNYFKVQVAERVLDIFFDGSSWKLAKIED